MHLADVTFRVLPRRMTSSSYRRGYSAENRARRWLESQGYVVIRSAGSKLIDLIAARKGEIRLIEVKYAGGKLNSDQKKFFEVLKRGFGVSHIEVWTYRPHKRKPEIRFF